MYAQNLIVHPCIIASVAAVDERKRHGAVVDEFRPHGRRLPTSRGDARVVRTLSSRYLTHELVAIVMQR